MNLHKYLIAESFPIHEQLQHDIFFQICHFLGYFSLAGKKKILLFRKKIMEIKGIDFPPYTCSWATCSTSGVA